MPPAPDDTNDQSQPLQLFSTESESADDDELELDGDPDALPRPGLPEVIAHLEEGGVTPSMLVGLSDLSRAQITELRPVWASLDEEHRERVLLELIELAEDRYDTHFGRIFRLALTDPSATIRQRALGGLWDDEGSDLPDLLLSALQADPADDVRIQAAQSLAPIATKAVLGELEADYANRLGASLFAILDDPAEPLALRRRALEAVAAFGSNPTLDRHLVAMYEDDDSGLRSSAVFAMGQTLDPRWYATVLDELVSDDAEVRYEAARATGHYGDASGLPALADLATDEDDEVRQAAISAIGEIGGRPAMRMLQRLAEQAGTDADLDAIQDAISEASVDADPLLLDDEDETDGRDDFSDDEDRW
ncbi:MAG: HEAT repeat domain-containing protein [Thermomicrobiales bacterium]